MLSVVNSFSNKSFVSDPILKLVCCPRASVLTAFPTLFLASGSSFDEWGVCPSNTGEDQIRSDVVPISRVVEALEMVSSFFRDLDESLVGFTAGLERVNKPGTGS